LGRVNYGQQGWGILAERLRFSPAIQLSPMVPSKATFPSPVSIENKDNNVFEGFFWR
jgi:hypothetical protein